MRAWCKSARLGLIAGAILYAAPVVASAQVVPAPTSDVPIPVKPKTDSGAADSTLVKLDTIKASIGRFADPVLYEVGPQYEWNREQLFATGALNLAELLDRIPEVTVFRSGWLATPHTATFDGDFRRVRVFYDGIEIDNLDNTSGGVLDLTTVPIWNLEHASIERSAIELRVYLRSWRVNNTTPYTRADIATGNEDTNLYRGFYGKRFDNGGVLQLAAQQFGVTSPRFAGNGDALSLLGRVGVARKNWSVDAFVTRTHATRGIERAFIGRPPVLGVDATNTDAYLRAAVGKRDGGPWLQLTAASLGFKGTTQPDRNVGAGSQPDTLERRASESQYVLSGGVTKGVARIELTERLRTLGGETFNSPSARLDFATPLGVLSGYAEHDGRTSTTHVDAGMRAQPLSFLAFAGSVAQSKSGSSAVGPSTFTSFRGEVGLRIFGPWFTGGVISTDKTEGLAPLVYDTLFLPTPPGRTSGVTASIRGPISHGIGIDAWAVRWDGTSSYQPQYQSRSEINYANNFLHRFPSGDFEVRFAGVYEYRGHQIFPLAAGDVRIAAAKTISAMLEIRIMRAVLSYQQRNLMSYQYEIVPGFEMPRVLAIYGVRWEFWN